MYVNSDSSDWLSQSVASSASWYDELEGETTTKLADQLEHLDHILYGELVDKHFPHGDMGIVNECHQWKQQFPHLRVNGSSIKIPASCQTESNRERIEEKIEEIFAAHGEYIEEDKKSEEINVTEPDLITSDDKIVVSDNVDDQEVFKEKIKSDVLEQIFIRIWPNVLKKVEPFLNSIKNNRKLSDLDIHSRTFKTEISTDDDNCDVISSSLSRLTLTPIVNSSASLPDRLKSVRDCNSNVNRNHTAVFPIKSVVIEPPISLLSLPARNTTALKSPIKLLQPVIKFPSPECLLSPIPVNEIKSAGTHKKKQSAKTAAERKCVGQNCKSQVHNDSRCGGRRILKTSPPSNLSHHITLPPIVTNVQFSAVKVRSTTGKRCVSTLWKVEPELRPSTSHGNKSYLSPLDINFSTDTSRPEVDKHWLDEQPEYTCSNGKSKIGLPKQQDQKVKWKSRGAVRK